MNHQAFTGCCVVIRPGIIDWWLHQKRRCPLKGELSGFLSLILILIFFFFIHRWERECRWTYRYLSVPVNLCCHIVGQLPPPGEKCNQRDSLSAGALPGWSVAEFSLKHGLAETKRERGKWGESCLKFGLCEEFVSLSLKALIWPGNHDERIDWLPSRPFPIQP